VRRANALNCGLHFRDQGAKGKSYFDPPQGILVRKHTQKSENKGRTKAFNELKFNKRHNKEENQST